MKKFTKNTFLIVAGGTLLGQAFLSPQHKKDFEGVFNGFINTFRAAYIVGLSIHDYQTGFGDLKYNTPEYIKRREEIHTTVANRILKLSQINRGIYLKAGQYLGNLERIMPKEYTDVLKVLQDSGPCLPFDDIKIVVEQDLGKIEDIFIEFDKKALAAASLAQVHRAKLKENNTEVAVKIQFPFLRSQTQIDLAVIGKIVKVCDYLIKKSNQSNIHLHEQYTNFKKVLLEELNFYNEKEKAELTQKQFQHYDKLYIPKYFEHVISQRILTMEFIKGCKINDVQGIENLGLNTLECANILIEIMGKMLFKTGHIHADPHPGNIFVRNHPKNQKEPQIVLLDHGFYVEVNQQIQRDFSLLWWSLISFDYKKMKEVANSLGIGKHYKYLPIIFLFRTMESTKKLGVPMNKEDTRKLYDQNLISFEKISLLVSDLPPEMIFMIRANNIIAIHNAVLGGTTRQRIKQYSKFVIKSLFDNRISYFYHYLLVQFKIFLFENFHNFFRWIYQASYSQQLE